MEEKEIINRTHTREKRVYSFVDARIRLRRRIIRWGLMCVCLGLFGIGAWNVLAYYREYRAAQLASAQMRAAYHEAEAVSTQEPDVSAPMVQATELIVPLITPVPTVVRSDLMLRSASRHTVAPSITLPPQGYEDNPYGIIHDKFQKLRRQNADVIGWLTIEGVLDEAVVQRDNEYYLRRDYLGYHNANGAVFLDERCVLRGGRPYTFMLYAHNMKNGAMFGSLRNYENIGFYRKNPFVTFDTVYENGRYVIFAISTITLDWQKESYVDFNGLMSMDTVQRQKSIYALKAYSTITPGIDVQADDQLLLLITCVGDTDQRRVVAARRIREHETEAGLLQQVQSSQY